MTETKMMAIPFIIVTTPDEYDKNGKLIARSMVYPYEDYAYLKINENWKRWLRILAKSRASIANVHCPACAFSASQAARSGSLLTVPKPLMPYQQIHRCQSSPRIDARAWNNGRTAAERTYSIHSRMGYDNQKSGDYRQYQDTFGRYFQTSYSNSKTNSESHGSILSISRSSSTSSTIDQNGNLSREKSIASMIKGPNQGFERYPAFNVITSRDSILGLSDAQLKVFEQASFVDQSENIGQTRLEVMKGTIKKWRRSLNIASNTTDNTLPTQIIPSAPKRTSKQSEEFDDDDDHLSLAETRVMDSAVSAIPFEGYGLGQSPVRPYSQGNSRQRRDRQSQKLEMTAKGFDMDPIYTPEASAISNIERLEDGNEDYLIRHGPTLVTMATSADRNEISLEVEFHSYESRSLDKDLQNGQSSKQCVSPVKVCSSSNVKNDQLSEQPVTLEQFKVVTALSTHTEQVNGSSSSSNSSGNIQAKTPLKTVLQRTVAKGWKTAVACLGHRENSGQSLINAKFPSPSSPNDNKGNTYKAKSLLMSINGVNSKNKGHQSKSKSYLTTC